ncbi:hypothetical protein EMIHUDRAFT_217164 [Emiliania huxleyi CCMP1516]|uniref:Uncharacterized protein n=2 Tax=Emiliania huxleyi TaxID=2903 RepID=A0A0D3IC75_EMIH1|nr:hypothetical protein EMIHUDRAFT_217164 [Emiliania huxleyi CCMP1516]EOD08860.1 hypothetical protein EMIHUDRAFT_217164 [Emiliania huxleyi CCMP1516]|eukprot:XP_005761289.1 hypothetical protein EMIHUDRAFT_217164 [Emiliania huxleyi CCMP1516]
MGPEWDRNEYWDTGIGTQALSCRWRAPPTPTVGAARTAVAITGSPIIGVAMATPVIGAATGYAVA